MRLRTLSSLMFLLLNASNAIWNIIFTPDYPIMHHIYEFIIKIKITQKTAK